MTIDTCDAKRVGVLSETTNWKLNVAINVIENFNEALFALLASVRVPASTVRYDALAKPPKHE